MKARIIKNYKSLVREQRAKIRVQKHKEKSLWPGVRFSSWGYGQWILAWVLSLNDRAPG